MPPAFVSLHDSLLRQRNRKREISLKKGKRKDERSADSIKLYVWQLTSLLIKLRKSNEYLHVDSTWWIYQISWKKLFSIKKSTGLWEGMPWIDSLAPCKSRYPNMRCETKVTSRNLWHSSTWRYTRIVVVRILKTRFAVNMTWAELTFDVTEASIKQISVANMSIIADHVTNGIILLIIFGNVTKYSNNNSVACFLKTDTEAVFHLKHRV